MMDVNEAQEEYEEVQTELRKKDEEVKIGCTFFPKWKGIE